MTHKQKPSQSIIILFTARTNTRHTLFSPSSPADAQLRPGSAAMSPGGSGANAGLSPRRAPLRPAELSGRGNGAPSCPRGREEPGRTGHGPRKRKKKKGAAPRCTFRLQPRSPGQGAPAASERCPGTAARCGAAAPPPLTATSAAFFVHVGAAHTALRDGRGSGRPRARSSRCSLPPSPPLHTAAPLPGPGPGPLHPALPQPRRQLPLRPSRPPLSCDPRGGGGKAGPGRIRAAAAARSPVLAVLSPPLRRQLCSGVRRAFRTPSALWCSRRGAAWQRSAPLMSSLWAGSGRSPTRRQLPERCGGRGLWSGWGLLGGPGSVRSAAGASKVSRRKKRARRARRVRDKSWAGAVLRGGRGGWK